MKWFDWKSLFSVKKMFLLLVDFTGHRSNYIKRILILWLDLRNTKSDHVPRYKKKTRETKETGTDTSSVSWKWQPPAGSGSQDWGQITARSQSVCTQRVFCDSAGTPVAVFLKNVPAMPGRHVIKAYTYTNCCQGIAPTLPNQLGTPWPSSPTIICATKPTSCRTTKQNLDLSMQLAIFYFQKTECKLHATSIAWAVN